MARRLALLLLSLLLLATPAAAQDAASRKNAIDARIASLQSRIAQAQAREQALASQIASVSARIQTLEARVGDVSNDLAALEHDLALQQEKLDRLNELFRLQSQKLDFLRRQHAAAVDRLYDRIVAAYQSGDVEALEVVLAAESFSDLVTRLDYVKQLAAQDARIADQVGAAKEEVRVERARTKKTRARVAAVARVIAIRTAQQREIRDRLVASEQALSSAKQQKQQTLTSVQHSKEEFIAEVDALAQVSAQLGSRIQSAQARVAASPSPIASSSGFIWPVSGPVVSPFGMRWGRMHEGIDIGAASGTPIRAVASGRVIHTGWMGGYGNLVVIDHGRGLATAYAHASSIASSVGQAVSQGQVVSYVGCTGHCFGPHLHFEVRVNGSPVDPLGYL